MLQRRVERLSKAFYNQDKASFFIELDVIKSRAQLSDREIYNALKAHLGREHWPRLRNWIFD